MNYEQALEDCGGYGKFQVILMLLLGSTAFKAGFNLGGVMFQPYKMNFRCADGLNSSDTDIFDNSCFDNSSQSNIPCRTFQYDTSVLRRTLVSDFDLVCDRYWLISLLQSLSFAGSSFGKLLAVFADKIGRRKSIFIYAILDAAICWVPLIMPTIENQIISRVFVNIPETLNMLSFMILSELVSNRHRPLNSCLYWLFWCSGYASCSGVAKLFPDWRYILMSMYVPMIIYPFFLWMTPESPRWLALKKRHEEALEVYDRISKFNGGKFDINKYKQAILMVDEDREQENELLNVLKSPIMRCKYIILLYFYWVIGLVYYGLAIHANFATSDVFLNGLLNGLIEIPSYILTGKCLDFFGRKKSVIGAMLICGVAVVLVPFLPSSGTYWIVRTVVAMIGKLLMTSCHLTKDMYLAELTPTSVRSVLLFVASCLSGVASLIAPFVLGWSKKKLFFLTGIVFGAHALVCGFLLLFLPETYDCPLPQTVEEADKLVAGKENLVRMKLARNARTPTE